MKANKSTKVVKQPLNRPDAVWQLRERRQRTADKCVYTCNKPYSMSFEAWYCHMYTLRKSPFFVLETEMAELDKATSEYQSDT